MKLIKKLLPAAIAVSSIVAATTTLVGCQCSGTDYAKVTWSFAKNGEWNPYKDKISQISSDKPVNDAEATKLYYDNINNYGKRFAADVMYNIDADILKLHNDPIPEKFDVSFEVTNIALEPKSETQPNLLSLSFKIELDAKKTGAEETHSYINVSNMKYLLSYSEGGDLGPVWSSLPYKSNNRQEEIAFLSKDDTWSIDICFNYGQPTIPELNFNSKNFKKSPTDFAEHFGNTLSKLVHLCTDWIYSMHNVGHSETL